MRGGASHVPVARGAAYPLRSGNRLVPLVDGEPAFRRICEAVERARSSVFVTVAYLERDVAMPGGRGSFFDVLDRAASRGIDVRVLFWREPRLPELEPYSSHFPGDEAERAWLRERGARFLARWDSLPEAFCQHQKSWIVDAGEGGEVAFVGGINLDADSISAPGHVHPERPHVHDVYVELSGPAATDVHHNFVQRWNEASERLDPSGVWPDPERAHGLEFPSLLSPPAGEVPVQISRTVFPGCYRDETATPGGKPFSIAEGEKSVLEQYVSAIDAAREAVYFENQAIGSPAIVDAIDRATQRGVEVAFLVPGNAHPAFVEARRDPRAGFFFEHLARLGERENFTLAALAGSRGDGRYDEIYVHAKVAIIDDAWATIGSANVADRSFRRDTELNASFWHPETARAFRVALLEEHIGRDTSSLGAREAVRVFREVALRNLDRRICWEPLEGLLYAIDPAQYGR